MKTKEEVMFELYEVCRLRCYNHVAKILEEHRDEIDFSLYGIEIFEFIIADHETKTLSALLDFYTKTRLQGDPESLEYKFAYKRLQNLLEEASESSDIVPEIEAIIGPYLPKEEESEDESEFNDIDVEDFGHSTVHKSHSEPDFIQHQVEAKLWHSSSESLISELDSSGSEIHDARGLYEADLIGAQET